MNKDTFNKFSLLQVLVLMLILSLSIPLPIILTTYAYGTYETKQQEQAVINTKKFNLSAEIFIESLWNFYPELGQKMMDQLLLDSNVLTVKVIDMNHKIFLASEKKYDTSKYTTSVIQKTLEKDGMAIGSLEVTFHQIRLMESILSDMSLFGPIILLQTLLVIAFVSLIYYQKIVRPMKRLVEHSALLSEQKLDEPFEWKNNDEIGTLGVALNDARVKLKGLFEALRYENEKLDEKVKQRTQELENISRYKSEFLANMSHEIRTPMNAITGMSHLLSKTALNATQVNYISKIKEASSILLHIINDILDYSKIEAGKMDVENIAFDMHKEIKKSCSIFSILTKEKNIDLKCNFIDTHRFFKGDPYKIMQIINNFLSNAIKFTSHGSVSLKVFQKESSNAEEQTLIFSVTDTGIGISKEKQSLLFQAFGQLDASITRKHGGTGLGLYICTQLAHLMQGHIYVESEETKGSTFSLEITLPLAQGLDILPHTNTKDFQPLHLLVIEDDEILRNELSSVIRSFGYFVTTQKSSDALDLSIQSAQSAYHIVVINDTLNDTNGLAFYEKISSDFGAEKIPNVIFLSDNDTDTFRKKVAAKGIKSVLIKPVNPSKLYDEILAQCDVPAVKPMFNPSSLDLSQKNILIVEDNDINLEVALYLLKDTRAKIDIARNGLEAVDKVKHHHYDVILMDLQMPLMDGYEATRIIRRELNSKIPIVAMTANVMAQDIEKCLSSGMDFHIGKPFEIEDFYGVLLEALHVSLTLQPISESPKVLRQFDKEDAIRKLGGTIALWEKIMCSFYEQYGDFEVSLKRLVDENDITTLLDYLHTLKGLSGTIGANILQEEASKIEAILKKSSKLDDVKFDILLLEYREFFKILADEYKKITINANTTLMNDENKEEILKLLEELLLMVHSSNVSRINLVLDNLALFNTIKEHTLFKMIALSCKQFDFETAQEHIMRLKEEYCNG